MNLPRLGLMLAALLALAACGEEGWHGKSIEGLMPELEFRLTSETGETVTEQVFEGRPVAMYFGFTHCPDICPATLARLVAAVRRLPEPQQERLQLAFVSVDPERDGPEQLRDYTDAFSERMLGLTGTQKQLKTLTRRYRTTYGYEERREDGSYEVSHSSAIFVFDADLEPRLMLLDSLGVAEIAADLERLLQ
ncbi:MULTISPECIES: SCO family protein [unclassified Wenzhouxiangella]|uniref:SCO family protein n=1 Tax=unclassified Wenzhouxiangella TaxID=2613841 RepID=UPI000E3264A8|nr:MULTISPECIES: SCO family protein [unclassified Wenzhouxiangella]RFF27035.1 SCO family protein [Wenzhouxiangella sp. 15181]RFP67548.1 SCO family protein [Wenzhouxiangella sp. 15190]